MCNDAGAAGIAVYIRSIYVIELVERLTVFSVPDVLFRLLALSVSGVVSCAPYTFGKHFSLSSADRFDRLVCSDVRVWMKESNVVSAFISLKPRINDYGIDGFLDLPVIFIYS